jgi:exonuclease SbcC
MQISINEQESKVASLLDLVKDHENIYTRAISLIKSVSLELVHPLLGDSNEVLQKISDSSLSSRAPYELQHIFSEKILSIAEELKVKLSDFRSRWAVLEQMKSDYQTKKRRFDELTSQRSERLKLKDKLFRLNLIIGKDELRSFVLSMIEKNLVSQTNFELNHLCFGRYQISQQFKSSKISPDFYIIDKFNNGERRKISTLSGGETFMVSLAMALALSELTRGKTEINTLFIDEGFGTLDLDSLSDVIEMLNQIQTRGLMIGIISHVKSLTDSLPINIHLSKMTSGNSKMRIIYH